MRILHSTSFLRLAVFFELMLCSRSFFAPPPLVRSSPVRHAATISAPKRAAPPRLDTERDMPSYAPLGEPLAPPSPPAFSPARGEFPIRLRRGAPGSVRQGVWSLLEAVHRESASAEDTRKVWDAFVLSHKLHRHQRRRSGEPYITHPLEVAAILARQRMDLSSIITGLLHDTVEDTGATNELLAERFGDEVARLVDGVTKFTSVEMLKLTLDREAAAGNAKQGNELVYTDIPRAQSERCAAEGALA